MGEVTNMTAKTWEEISKQEFDSTEEEIRQLREAYDLDLPKKDFRKFVNLVDKWIETERVAGFSAEDSSRALANVENFMSKNQIIFAVTHRRYCDGLLKNKAKAKKS
jgi:hypothetical protein